MIGQSASVAPATSPTTLRNRKSSGMNRGSQPCQCTVPPPTICGTGQKSSTRVCPSVDCLTVRGLRRGSGVRLCRLIMASSSPANDSFVRHGPRSRATTRNPRSASTLAAIAPEAPAPMMQTSVRSGLVAAVMLMLSRRVRMVLGEVGQGAVAGGLGLGEGSRADEPDQRPSDVIAIPAVRGVGVEALACV